MSDLLAIVSGREWGGSHKFSLSARGESLNFDFTFPLRPPCSFTTPRSRLPHVPRVNDSCLVCHLLRTLYHI